MEKDLLSNFDFFSDIPLDKLSLIAESCDVRTLNPGDVIFRWGDSATHLYGVLDGEVELSLMFKDKLLKTDIEYEEAIQVRFEVLEKPIVVDRVGKSEVFGWTSLVKDAGLMTATARCAEPSQIFSIPADILRSAFEKDAALGYMIMKRVSNIISQRLENRTDKLVEAWGEAFGTGSV